MGLRGVPPKAEGRPAIRLEILPAGDISFVSVTESGYCVIIDMPVTDWKGGQMMFPCGGPPLPFEFDGKSIAVSLDGKKVSLQRVQHNLNVV